METLRQFVVSVHGAGTFEKGSAIDEVPPVREALATRAQLGVLWAALFRTLVTLGAPGYTH